MKRRRGRGAGQGAKSKEHGAKPSSTQDLAPCTQQHIFK